MVKDHVVEEHDQNTETIYGHRLSSGEHFFSTQEPVAYTPKRLRIHAANLLNSQCQALTVTGRDTNGLLQWAWAPIINLQHDQVVSQSWQVEAMSPWSRTVRSIVVQNNMYPALKCECQIEAITVQEYRSTYSKHVVSCHWKLVQSLTNFETPDFIRHMSAFDIRIQNCKPLGRFLKNSGQIVPVSMYNTQREQYSASESLGDAKCQHLLHSVLAEHQLREQQDKQQTIAIPTDPPGATLTKIKKGMETLEIAQKLYTTVTTITQHFVAFAVANMSKRSFQHLYPKTKRRDTIKRLLNASTTAADPKLCPGPFSASLKTVLETHHVAVTPNNANVSEIVQHMANFTHTVAECMLPVLNSVSQLANCATTALVGPEKVSLLFASKATEMLGSSVVAQGSPADTSRMLQLKLVDLLHVNSRKDAHAHDTKLTDLTLETISLLVSYTTQTTVEIVQMISSTKQHATRHTLSDTWCCLVGNNLPMYPSLINSTDASAVQLSCATLLDRRTESIPASTAIKP
jgi:hypothetical protein